MGFSQTGWVAHAVAQKNPDVGFVIGVEFAINWQEQGWCLTKARLKSEGKSAAEITIALAQHLEEYAFLPTQPSYQSYIETEGNVQETTSPVRFQFILKNYDSDASNDYNQINQPILMLLGSDDLNVDVEDAYDHLFGSFKGRNNLTLLRWLYILPH